MGTFSIWHWIVLVLLIGFLLAFLWPFGRILTRAGYSRWWLLVLFVPFVNFIMWWVFAFANWPAATKRSNP